MILRGTQSVPGKPPDTAVLALRVALSKTDGRWLVDDVPDQLPLSLIETARDRSRV